MSETDSFIDEVNEEVRRDRLYAALRRYGWIAIVAVLAIVGGAALTNIDARRIWRLRSSGAMRFCRLWNRIRAKAGAPRWARLQPKAARFQRLWACFGRASW